MSKYIVREWGDDQSRVFDDVDTLIDWINDCFHDLVIASDDMWGELTSGLIFHNVVPAEVEEYFGFEVEAVES